MCYPEIDAQNEARLFESILKKYDELGKPREKCNDMSVVMCIPVQFNLLKSVINLAREYKTYVFSLKEGFGFELFNYPSAAAASQLIKSLELALFDRENKYISYFIHELNFGEEWMPGMVYFNDKEFRLKTVDDLWVLLLENIKLKIQNSEI